MVVVAIAIQQSYISPFFKSSIVSIRNPKKLASNRWKNKSVGINNAMEQPFLLPVFPFNDYMSLKVNQVNKSLEEISSSFSSLQNQTEIQKAMSYSLLSSGKRLRAILCLASCDLVGGNESEAMPISCAIEMIHAMSLMFDDLPCLDNDDIRRGIPSNHKVFGEDGTILAGTSLVFLAFQHIIAKSKNVSPKRVMKSIYELSSSAGFDGLQGGQLLDVRLHGKEEISLIELNQINSLKSSKLFEASLVCGAIMGEGNAVEIERLRKYGKHIGLCFQVWDDIIDFNKDQKVKKSYPNLIGIDGARKYVEEELVKAVEELSHFEPSRAAPLYHIANYVVNLKN